MFPHQAPPTPVWNGYIYIYIPKTVHLWISWVFCLLRLITSQKLEEFQPPKSQAPQQNKHLGVVYADVYLPNLVLAWFPFWRKWCSSNKTVVGNSSIFKWLSNYINLTLVKIFLIHLSCRFPCVNREILLSPLVTGPPVDFLFWHKRHPESMRSWPRRGVKKNSKVGSTGNL